MQVTHLYTQSTQQINKNKPILFLYPVTVLLPVDFEHNDHFPQCWHTPGLLSRKEVQNRTIRKYSCRNKALFIIAPFPYGNLAET